MFTVTTGDDHVKATRGPWAFTTPLAGDVRTDGYATFLCFDGVDARASVTFDSYTSFVCFREMAGRAFFDSYATAFVDGALSGQITAMSYFNLVVTGPFTGRLTLDSYSMVYLLGGLEGQIELRASTAIYVAGHTPKAALSGIQRKGGGARIYLESSDLPEGQHRVGELSVLVGD